MTTAARPGERRGDDRPVIAGLAALAAVLYLAGLTVSGYANTYYAMAAQAASTSWSAWFFGALDGSSFITLDKPPLATMLMGLSVRVLGLGPLSVLLPQALLGVGTVIVLFLAVRRSFGPRAAALAGLLMAVTPVAVLMFRYDNPDALLTFLLVAAAWALGRGLEAGRIRWAVLAAALVGAGFLTKYLQAWIVLPVFALAWLVSAPGSLRRRLGGLLASAVAAIVASGWWVAVVEAIPAGSRPYIGGSSTDSVLDLVLGYDGLGRIFGAGRGTGGLPGSGLGSGLDGLVGPGGFGPGGPAGGGPTFGGSPGVLRMLNDQFGGEVGWLVPAAVLGALVLAAVLVAERHRRTDGAVGGAIVWIGWLAIHLAVFSLMSGIVHPYYAVALAPGVAAVAAVGAVALWDRRATHPAAGAALGFGVFLTGATAWILLEREPTFAEGLGLAAFGLAAAAGIVIAIPAGLLDRRIPRVAAVAALAAVLAGPTAWSVATTRLPHAGGDPQAGPFGDGDTGAGPASSIGADAALVSYLLEHRGDARWIAAVRGSGIAAGLQLAAQAPVMTVGGFSGNDPAPTLDELRSLASTGRLRFVVEAGFSQTGGGFPGGSGPQVGSGPSAARAAWLQSACRAFVVPGSTSGVTVFDCAGAG